MENCEIDASQTKREVDEMASKFRINIGGDTGSVIVGDHTNVKINSTRGNRGKYCRSLKLLYHSFSHSSGLTALTLSSDCRINRQKAMAMTSEYGCNLTNYND